MKANTSPFRNAFLIVILTQVLALRVFAVDATDGDVAPAIVQRCKAATVLVDLGPRGSGSGFLVHACGLFVTNRHVVADLPAGGTVKVVLNSGDSAQRILQARVALISEDDDLALLKTDEPVKVEPLRLTDDAGLAELARIFVLGYPFGKMLASGSGSYPSISINGGRVSALRREEKKLEKIQLDAATNPGNSGGPVIKPDGSVVGVIVSGIRGAGVNFAIPAGKVIRMIAQPVLSLRAPAIPYVRRGEAQRFEVEILPTAPVPADAELTMYLGDPAAKRRAIAVPRNGGKYSVKAAPLEIGPATPPLRLRVEATIGMLTVSSNMNDCPVQIGTRHLQLSEIRNMETRGKVVKTELVEFDRDRERNEIIEGRVVGFPPLRSEINAVEFDLEKATKLRVSAYDPSPLKVPYEIALTTKGKSVAASRGSIEFVNPPQSFQSDDQQSDVNIFTMTRIFGGMAAQKSVDAMALVDLAKDTRQGIWKLRDGELETEAEAGAWCELPIIPSGDYGVAISLKPDESGKGELLVHLPIGKARALLHFDGSPKGLTKLDLVGAQSADSEGAVPGTPFEKGKELTLNLLVSIYGENVRIIAMQGETRPLVWAGKMKDLAKPQDCPIAADRLGVGHHHLAMAIHSIRLDHDEGGLRVMRELPGDISPDPNRTLAHWRLDTAPKHDRLPGLRGEHYATVTGKAEFGVAPGVAGSGAMKLGSAAGGFIVRECPHTTGGWNAERTISFWFRADDVPNQENRQYLYDEGGNVRGLAIYLHDGALFAGGWDTDKKANWKGTWLKAPGILQGKWYHVALVLAAAGKEKRNAFRLYLDGNEVGKGFGQGLDKREPISVGCINRTTRSCETDPADQGAKNRQFTGMIDEVIIHNGVFPNDALQILAGGRFGMPPALAPAR